MATDATVLLTGFPGFLGSALLPRLLARGEGPVACLVQPHHRETAEQRLSAVLDAGRERTETSERSGESADLPPVRLVEGDITEPDLGLGGTRASLLGVDTVYHFAAVYHLAVERAVGEAVNVDGTRHVLDFATDAGVDRFHYVSTCYSGSEAKAHGFSRGMKPTTGEQTTGVGLPDIPTF